MSDGGSGGPTEPVVARPTTGGGSETVSPIPRIAWIETGLTYRFRYRAKASPPVSAPTPARAGRAPKAGITIDVGESRATLHIEDGGVRLPVNIGRLSLEDGAPHRRCDPLCSGLRAVARLLPVSQEVVENAGNAYHPGFALVLPFQRDRKTP